MATQNLKGNLELTCTSFIRNLDICSNQAKELQRTNALGAAKHRKADRELADWHFEGFDEATAVMEWVEEIKQVIFRCPHVRDDKGKTGNGEKPVMLPVHDDENPETETAGALSN